MLKVGQGARGVLTMLHQLRHDAILRIPNPQSMSVSTGAVFEYFDEVRKLVELAKFDVLFVDPYLDADFVSRCLSTTEFNGVLASWKQKMLVAPKTPTSPKAPAELTVAELVGGLKPTQLWSVLGALAVLVAGAFALGGKLFSG